jgi:hypothetical protein
MLSNKQYVECLVYVISPIHVIASISAVQTLHQKDDVRLTILVHWPGVTKVVVREIMKIVKEMTSSFRYLKKIKMLSSSDNTEMLSTRSIRVISEIITNYLGQEKFDELYYAHDIDGGMQQILCSVYSSARRICYGDAMGYVFDKRKYYSLYRGSNILKITPLFGFYKSLLNITRKAKQYILRHIVLSEFSPDIAALILPVDQSNGFLSKIPLYICDRKVVLSIIEQCAKVCFLLNVYVSDLLGLYANREKYILFTENYAEGESIDLDREIEMYCAIIRNHCEVGSVVFLKPHPGEILQRYEKISSSLISEYEIVPFSSEFKRYPIELWKELLLNCTVIGSGSPVLTLKYLYDVDVINPLNSAEIEKWFNKDKWDYYKNAFLLINEPLLKLKEWDGCSVLHS